MCLCDEWAGAFLPTFAFMCENALGMCLQSVPQDSVCWEYWAHYGSCSLSLTQELKSLGVGVWAMCNFQAHLTGGHGEGLVPLQFSGPG